MIKIKWLTEKGDETNFEFEYLTKVLFKDINSVVDIESDINIFSQCNNELLCNGKKTKEDIYVNLSDESLNNQYEYLNSDNIVLRSYYNPLIKHKKVFTIPLGFQSGYHNKNKEDTKNNKYAWSFIGQIKNHRKRMCEEFLTLSPNFVHFSSGWNSKDQISIEETRRIYSETVFALCPFGNINPDSFRIMESLEWGCIPVVVKFHGLDYYKYIFGKHPFVIGKNWGDAANKCRRIYKDKKELAKKQEEIKIWYKKFKENLADDMVRIICNKKQLSDQFVFQNEGKNNLFLKVVFSYHFGVFSSIKSLFKE